MKIVALPIETKVRELDGKLRLALHLAKEGWKVALGSLAEIKTNINTIKPNIYFGDSAVYKKTREDLYQALKEAGCVVIVLDTEGGIFYSPEKYLVRLSPKILEYVDYFFAWGEETKKIICEKRNFPSSNVIVTGNPSFDLLIPGFSRFYYPEAHLIQKEYGNYILINTRFGLINPYHQDIVLKNKLYEIDHLIPVVQGLFDYFVEAAFSLSKSFPDFHVIVRPHPSENHGTYKKIFKKEDNIHVEHKWSVHPWALAARAVIHNACTTGIESLIMNRPVLAYDPIDSVYSNLLPNQVTTKVLHVDELIETIRLINDRKLRDTFALTEEKRNMLEGYLHKLDGKAAIRICEGLKSISLQIVKDIHIGNYKKDGKIRQFWNKVRKSKIVQAHKFFRPKHRLFISYTRQKFPGLLETELADRIRRLVEIEPELSNVSFKRIEGLKGSYWIYKD